MIGRNQEAAKRKILIVDDHPLLRHGLAELIGQEPDLVVCGQASEVHDAIRQIVATKPDLVIVDISLKESSGLELIKQIKSYDRRTRILVATMYDESLYAERCLRAGAAGYVNKQELTESIIKAIREVLDGRIYLNPRTSASLLRQVVDGVTAERSSIDMLSDRELEVYTLIGRGLTTREIADKLHISVKTVETHRDHIKGKLGVRTGAELARSAVAWVLNESSPLSA